MNPDPAIHPVRARVHRWLLLALVAVLLVLAGTLGSGCAAFRGQTPDQLAYKSARTLDRLAQTACEAYAADYVRRERAHAERGRLVKDADWFTQKDALIREAGRFNGVVAAYQSAYRLALNGWLAVRGAGSPTPEQLLAFSAELAAAQKSLLAFTQR